MDIYTWFHTPSRCKDDDLALNNARFQKNFIALETLVLQLDYTPVIYGVFVQSQSFLGSYVVSCKVSVVLCSWNTSGKSVQAKVVLVFFYLFLAFKIHLVCSREISTTQIIPFFIFTYFYFASAFLPVCVILNFSTKAPFHLALCGLSRCVNPSVWGESSLVPLTEHTWLNRH